MELIELKGFKNITVQKEKAIVVPDDILIHYLSSEEIRQFKKSGTWIFSITVVAEKKLILVALRDVAQINSMPKRLRGEFLGTFALVFFVTGAIVINQESGGRESQN